jgi:YD repeat-containing protein
LHTGGYTVQAASVGYQLQEQGATVVEDTATTRNFALASAPAGSVVYAYDAAGRLAQVTDPSSAAATYRYDALGNILAIERSGTAAVIISGFVPASGAAGTAVTISGTGFSSTPSQNTVTFNGTAGTVTAATPTSLTVTVPGGASTGRIAATTPTGSATSTIDFVVTAVGAGPPTISGFTPGIAQAGSALTVSGTNFETNVNQNLLRVNVTMLSPTSATTTALNTTIPTAAGSGKLLVATPGGTATSSADLFIAPAGYTASQVDATGRLTIGTSQAVNINTTSHIGLSLFDGVPGQRISVVFTPGTITAGTGALYDPAGTRVKSTPLSFGGGNRFIEPEVLPMTGTYTVLTAPTSAAPANTEVTVHTVPPDLSGTVVPTQAGTQFTAALQTPGQNALYTIGTPTNPRVDLAIGPGPSGSITIRNANGTTVASTAMMPTTTFIEPWAFASGQTISVDPVAAGTGNISLTLWDVPPDLSGTVVPALTGTPVTAALLTPGQNATYTIGTPANTRVSAGVSAGPIGSVTVKNAAGGTVTSGSITFLSSFIEPWTFANGQTILVDPSATGTGNVTLTLFDVPPDTTGTVSIGGSPVTVANQSAGQKGTLTFTGSANQQVTVHVTGSSHGSLKVTLLSTDGETVLRSATSIFQNFDLQPVSLPTNGTYTIVVDPQGASIGQANISVTNP